MTIRFTKSWNGYYEGQIVSNPAGGNTEAQLIALGYAVSDLDGPDNSFELAKFATDPLTGAVTGLVGPGGGVYPLGGRRSTPVRVATFGDSTATYGSHGGVANAYEQTYLTIAAALATNDLRIGNGNKLLLQTVYPNCIIVGQGGISGNTTSDMIARGGSAAAATRNAITDILATAPDVILFRGASINDITGLSLTTNITSGQLSAIVSRHMRIALDLRGGGGFVIDEGCAGFSGASGVVPANILFVQDAVVKLNAAIASAIDALGLQDLVFLSPYGVTANTNGSFITGATPTADLTHLSYAGQYWLAQAEAVLLARFFGQPKNQSYLGQNLLDTLAYWAIGGALPTGFAWGTANCSTTGTAIEYDLNGQVCARGYTGATSASAYVTFALPFNIYTAAPAPAITVLSGNKYAVEVDYEVSTRDGSNMAPAFSVIARVNLQNSSSGRAMIDFGAPTVTGDAGDFGVSTIKGHSALAFQINDVTANLTSSCSARLLFNLPVLTAGYTIRISNPRIVAVT